MTTFLKNKDISSRMELMGVILLIQESPCRQRTGTPVVQGIFEMASDVDSYVEWELSEEGDLTV